MRPNRAAALDQIAKRGRRPLPRDTAVPDPRGRRAAARRAGLPRYIAPRWAEPLGLWGEMLSGGGYRRPWEARRIGTGVQEGVGDESQRRRLVGDQGHHNRALGPAGAYYGGALRRRLASLRGAVARHRPCGDGGSRP